jgi:ornithine--oxo-acid transaminase
MARRWGYNVKGIPDGKAKVLFPKKTFWGRSIAARAGSDDPLRRSKFGPFDGLGFELIEFNNLEVLENVPYYKYIDP